MPLYHVSAHFALLEEITQEELNQRFAELQRRLGDHTRPRAFGRGDDYVVSVVVEVESEEAAEAKWFEEVDKAVDASKLGHAIAQYTTPVTIKELT
jgi:hypothetical protein